MFFVPLEKLIIRERQRKSIGAVGVVELAASIRARGLLHPLTVRPRANVEGTEPAYELVAGERRSRAVRLLQAEGAPIFYSGIAVPVGTVPCVLPSDVSDIAAQETELEENLLREDLTWQDKAAAVSKLHALRRLLDSSHTQKDTALEVAAKSGEAVKTVEAQVSRALVVAQHLHDPDVQRAGNERDAFKIISRKMEAEFMADLGQQMPESEHTLIHGDCIPLMQVVPAKGQFDCIIVDPPYGMNAEAFGEAASLAHQYVDDVESAMKLCVAILQHGYSLCKPQAHLFMFCDLDNFHYLRDSAEELGWKCMRTPLIWSKGASGHVPDGAVGFRRTYETILFASKGGKKIKQVYSDILPVAAARDRIHAAQKPVELYSLLLNLSCIPGDKVLDPTCGSGTIFRAASALKLIAVGIEANEQYYNQARASLAQTGSSVGGVADF